MLPERVRLWAAFEPPDSVTAEVAGSSPVVPPHTLQMAYGMIWRREFREIGCNLGAFCTQFAPKN